ncbi:WG repeat-containing protein [Crocinitomicaceae bacterium CZZ-1]|uniref:WG repeat-containing protein n=1 Tax=Taishania pollutisoli TaxID=2766479 RepID=A0A8J6PL09_9FLAO|nr:WG repeat-containing protein [Taishania pollutisoli]MBC9813589.1 WG repeat-containing protein [Taishania pollutisoli]
MFGQLSISEFVHSGNSSLSFDTVATSILSVKKQDGKFGIINASGEWMVSPQYTQLGHLTDESRKPYQLDWKNGVVIVSKSGKYGAINCFGEEVIPCIYIHAPTFRNGLFYLEDNTGKYALADRTGKIVSKFTTAYPSVFQHGLKRVNLNKYQASANNYAFVNKKGDTLIRFSSADYAFSVLGHSEGMTAFVMYPLVYGLTQGGIGFLDATGKLAIPPVYASKHLKDMEVSAEWWNYKPAFHKGLALVLKGDTVIYIDKTGKEIIHFRDRPGEIVARDNFNANGFTQITYYFNENERRVRYTEIIDTTGATILQIKNDGHIGNDGIEVDFSRYEHSGYFPVVEPKGKTLYTSKLEKILFIPRSDEQYAYFSYSNDMGTCIVREDKQTGTSEYTHINPAGNQLYPYRPIHTYFDPLTNNTISMNGTLLELKNTSGEVLYSCDSCESTDLNRLKNYRGGLYNNSTGVYEIHKGKEILFVNYKGMLIDQFYSKQEVAILFSHISAEQKAYIAPEVSTEVSITIRQTDLDQLYKIMPWSTANRAKSGNR